MKRNCESSSNAAAALKRLKEGGGPRKPESSSGDPSVENWQAMVERLKSFKEATGDCKIPDQFDEDPELAAWVADQRQQYKSGLIPLGRIQTLIDLGLDLSPKNPRHQQWDNRFQQLLAFKDKYGHVQVPIQWEGNVQLANWVSKQRQEYKNLLRGRTTRLDQNRIRLLNGVGFAWQLQRGGRRRQLKPTKKKVAKEQFLDGALKRADDKDGEMQDANDDDEDDDDDSAGCILPGEVLIGQGAPVTQDNEGFIQDALKKRGASGKGSSQKADPPSGLKLERREESKEQRSDRTGNGAAALTPTSGVASAAGVPPSNDVMELIMARNQLIRKLQQEQLRQEQLQLLRAGSSYPGGVPFMGGVPGMGGGAGSMTANNFLLTNPAARSFFPHLSAQFGTPGGAAGLTSQGLWGGNSDPSGVSSGMNSLYGASDQRRGQQPPTFDRSGSFDRSG